MPHLPLKDLETCEAPKGLKIQEKQDLTASTVAFVSHKVVLGVKLAGARWGSVKRRSMLEGGNPG